MWIQNNVIGTLGIIIGGFIAYHVFFLSKKLSNKAKLEHKEKIKEIAEKYLFKIHKENLRNKVYLVNINRYFKDYPSNKEKLISGYSHIRAEIKSTRFNGIEFFCSMPEQAYKNPSGRISFSKEKNEKAFMVYPVGLVPYEWIEYIDVDGDEYEGTTLFYCRFKGNIYWKGWLRRIIPFGYPYKFLTYYKESETYHDGSDPRDMKWRQINISK